ncbi:hypothetical protein [Haloechinothrix salitolerans]|uniref:Uncharacterized protein n=1 Tax=Haloechinothrix salitolerans TaxID=926830 RepID=A0ABW2BYM5_9PSEU
MPAHQRHSKGGVSARVRFCPVDPNSGIDDRIVTVVRVLVAAYTAPGERVALADATTSTAHGSWAAREHRDRLIETVLRLGRGATTEPPQPTGATPRRSQNADRNDAWSGSGPGPHQPPATVTEPAARAATDRTRDRNPDQFRLIIFGCTRHPAEAASVIDWAPHLARHGTLIVLTHSSGEPDGGTARSGSSCEIDALANLALTDRLLLAHRAAGIAPSAQRAYALGSRHRIHTTASVFRPAVRQPEVRDA